MANVTEFLQKVTMRILFFADQELEKQTFIARSMDCLKARGIDTRVVLTRVSPPPPDSLTLACCGVDAEKSSASYVQYALLQAMTYLSPRNRAYVEAYADWGRLGRLVGTTQALPWFKAKRRIADWRPQLIHVQFAWNLPFALPVARFFDIPVVCTVRGSDVYVQDAWRELLREDAIRRVACVSGRMKAFIDAEVPALRQKTIQVYNPIPEMFFDSPVAPPAEMRVVMVATLRKLKNHVWLLRALQRLRGRGVRLQCVFVGEAVSYEPETEAHVRAAVSEMGLEEDVTFRGWQSEEEVIRELDNSTVLALTSESEGLPTVVVEALARQRMPVVTDLPGTREATDGGRFGVLVPLNDTDGLAEALLAAHDATVAQGEVSRQGREFVQQHFDPTSHAEQMREIYESALAERNPG